MANSRGAVKGRHLETTGLWIQKHVTDLPFERKKESGKTNVPDTTWKHVDRLAVPRHVTFGRAVIVRDGRTGGRTV